MLASNSLLLPTTCVSKSKIQHKINIILPRISFSPSLKSFLNLWKKNYPFGKRDAKMNSERGGDFDEGN